ncbi:MULTISPECIES: sulfatase-like hydrolase/transferase [Micrococcaceae]|uniref:sulfatase-like hydrolase/transferase n=1 Tax=unclassified Kocuria TaxID=2649579 RepID=UPI001EDE292F|nr:MULTISPECIES: sulfatase-like hydrolase/transferase [unclassified Kocuria]
MPTKYPKPSRRIGAILGMVLFYLVIWFGLVLLVAGLGIHWFWGEVSVRQMATSVKDVDLSHGFASEWLGFFGIVVVPAVITLAIALVHLLRIRKRRLGSWDPRPRTTRRMTRALSASLVLILIVTGTSVFSSSVGLADFVRAASSDMDIGDYYAEPEITDSTHKRNIVNIYLESGEQTLGDENLFEKDPYAPLEDRTADWQSVENYQQYEGGGWTMAGMVSTQCGIPLKGTSSPWYGGGNTAPPDGIDSYLNGTTCLGDVLKQQGYKNVFMGGAGGEFASKDTFLQNHGFDETKDLADWKAAGEPEKNFREDWGLSDERLLDHAKDEIDQLHADSEKTGQPFNLSTLTLDTHEPTTVYDYCQVDTNKKLTSVYQCSMEKVVDYVNYMEEKGYLDDTAVVIQGDHLKHMASSDSFHKELDKNNNRSIFNRVWVPGEDRNRQLRPGMDQLSMYPTMLEAAGLQLKDHSAGLGVSGFTDSIPQDSAQALTAQEYRELLTTRSKNFYTKAWDGEHVRS